MFARLGPAGRTRARRAVAAAGALALVAGTGAAAGCSRNTGDTGGAGTAQTATGAISTDPKDSQGPAKAVEGAERGGTMYQYLEADYDHLDPARAYINNATAVDNLLVRNLTMLRDDGSGKSLLVGDLATGPGEDTSDKKCTSWKYTLKDGLKYEDGTAITAADVAYGVARSFSPLLSEGPHYIQQWLANSITYNATYKGPYDGGADVPPGVAVNGNTITFTFAKPHCDMPYAAAWGTTSPVPKAKDTKAQYDSRPFSSGPYKVATYTRDSKLVLDRNPYWDAKTDPVRHNYYDGFETDIGQNSTQQANAVYASNGKDANAVMGANVPPAVMPKVSGDPNAKKRVAANFTNFVWYLAINNQRITDLKERQALNYAFDRTAFLQALGGAAVGEAATTILSPTTSGYQKYDAYPHDENKAKQLLAGAHPELVFAYTNTARWQALATLIQSNLQRVGFKVTIRAVDSSSYYSTIGRRDNAYDLYVAGWGQDWPSGYTIIPPMFDGRTIQPAGNTEYPYFSNADVNTRIDELSAQPAAQAANGWAALDKDIMTKYAPLVPAYYDKGYYLCGTKVGNVTLSQNTGWPVFYNGYIKK